MTRKLAKLISFSTVWLLAACTTTQYSSQEQIDAALASKSEMITQYHIGPSDTLSVNVWKNADLSSSMPVRPDGRISVPLIGDIEAAGKAPEQLADDIAKKLSDFIREPKVSVVITSMSSHEFIGRVRVTGAVNAPMSTPFREGMTVMDMVLTAGGLSPFASPENAALYRKFEGEVVTIPVDLNAILLKGDISTNYTLQPGDIVTVPEKAF